MKKLNRYFFSVRHFIITISMGLAVVSLLEVLGFLLEEKPEWLLVYECHRAFFVVFVIMALIIGSGLVRGKNQRKAIQMLYQNNEAAVMVWKPDGQVISINDAYTRIIGFGQEIIGKKWMDYALSDEDHFELESFVRKLKQTQSNKNYITKVKTKSGKDIHMVWNDMYWNQGDGLIISFGTDLTKEVEQEERMLELMTIDSLTGFKNDFVFRQHIEALDKEKKAYSVVALNVDFFRKLNDLHGWKYGDKLLVEIGDYLKKMFPDYEIFRMQMDSFYIIVDTVNRSVLLDIALWIKRMSDLTWILGGLEYKTTFSIGLAVQTVEHPIDVEKGIKLALNKAKTTGKNKYVFYEKELLDEIKHNDWMENRLNEAIHQEEFEIYCQPFLDYNHEDKRYGEILLRWNHMPSEMKHIGEVIHFAEQTGQIMRVDRYVIEKVYEFIAHHEEQLKDWVFSVNVSTVSFVSDWFVNYIGEMENRFNIKGQQVTLEITETTFMEDMKKSQKVINQLQQKGYRIALDDFGTKYSSINYVRQYGFDTFKIDKVYVDDIVSDTISRNIVKMLIVLAKELDMIVVAEGVESKEQHQILIDLGCDFGQGYYYAKPMPVAQLLTTDEHSQS